MAARIMTVVGARPQFIKAAVVSDAIGERDGMDQLLVHTGQHFDYGMSQVFFDELGIPEPDVNLGISGGSHAQMTARMMVALEELMLDKSPDVVLLFGDTNSTLAAALSAAKLHVPIAHVEAGARTRSMTNPEEINRICTDHVSSLLLACTEDNLDNLRSEGLGERSVFVGDPMYDAFLKYVKLARKPHLVSALDPSETFEVPAHFYYLTCHREENTGDSRALVQILRAMNSLDAPTVYPVHPRNRAAVRDAVGEDGYLNILFCEPVGYLESLYLVSNAEQVVTDSGGLQREAFFANVKCTTILDFEVWPETMVGNRNLLAHPKAKEMLDAIDSRQEIDPGYRPFGNGGSAQMIVQRIETLVSGDGGRRA